MTPAEWNELVEAVARRFESQGPDAAIKYCNAVQMAKGVSSEKLYKAAINQLNRQNAEARKQSGEEFLKRIDGYRRDR